MNDALVLLTRPLEETPSAKRAAAFAVAAEVVLIENGVYNSADALASHGIGVDLVRVVADDADARRVATPFTRIGWDQVVDAIERNRIVITL